MITVTVGLEISLTSFQEDCLCSEIRVNSSGNHHKSKWYDKVLEYDTFVGVDKGSKRS